MEFLGWSGQKPIRAGWYWFKESVCEEDWKAEKVFYNKTNKEILKKGFWKPAEII